MFRNYKEFSICYMSKNGFPDVIEHVTHVFIRGKSYFVIFEGQPGATNFITADLSKVTIKAIKDIHSWLEFKGELNDEVHNHVVRMLQIEFNAQGFPPPKVIKAYTVKSGSGIKHREDIHFSLTQENEREIEYDNEEEKK